jgi:hypothetical protein
MPNLPWYPARYNDRNGGLCKIHLWVLKNKMFPGVFCLCFSAYTGFVAVAFRSVCESAEKNAHLVGFMSLLGDL